MTMVISEEILEISTHDRTTQVIGVRSSVSGVHRSEGSFKRMFDQGLGLGLGREVGRAWRVLESCPSPMSQVP